MKRFFFLLFSAGASTLAAGCGCTDVGCEDGVLFHVSAVIPSFDGSLPVTLEACADSTCVPFTLDKDAQGKLTCSVKAPAAGCSVDTQGGVDAQLFLSVGDQVTGKITARDGSAKILFQDSRVIQTSKAEPNGALCGPTCHSAEASFTPVSK